MAATDASGMAPALADRSISRRALGRPILAFFVLVLLALLCGPLLVQRLAQNPPHPKDGVISFAHWGALTRPVELSGQWILIWHGDRDHPGHGERLRIDVPGLWEGALTPSGLKLPESGLGTYELTIEGLPRGFYTVHIPDLYAASRIYIDGQLMSSVGTVGDSAETTVYLWRAQSVTFRSEGKPVRLAIEIADFHHRTNGLVETPEIALSSAMEEPALLSWTQRLVFCISLMLLGIFSLVVFMFRPKDRASLYFGLGAILALPTIAEFGWDNLVMLAFPAMPFKAMFAIQMLTSTLSIMFLVAYAATLYPRESPRPVFLALELGLFGFLLALIYAVLLGDTLLGSHILKYTTALDGAALIYILLVVAAASIRRREGALIFFLGTLAFVVPFLGQLAFHADLKTGGHNVVGDQFMPVGILILLYSHLVILAERWSVATSSAEEMTVDLRRLIDVSASITAEIRLGALLRKIVEATSKFVHADRSSLFLFDRKTYELIAFVAEGVETRQIRFASTLGLAGHCFTTGEIVNVDNAYEDPRFHRGIDAQTGYHTKSVLTLPVIARDGRRLGVMQALNRRDAKAFDAGDVTRMAAFAAQAAIAIDNATLFSEVTSERNYNESILRSMSNGVITFDAEGRVAKMNASGSAILELDPEQIVGIKDLELLAGRNAWLLDEFDAVRKDNQPRQLLDVEIVTVADRTISVNMSVVPLIGEGDAGNGLLILFEDISEEKRMQGAMRRFMTQKVVDQVLQRQDELLFGVSCRASVLFADIRNFTTMAEALSARETVDMLNEIFTELVESVAGSDGVLDKFIGDAVMAVFGAPLSSGRDADNSVECAIGMMYALAKVNARRSARGASELKLGIGISTGDVVAGTIGSPKRMDYTVIGDSVNLASRLQVLTKTYGASVIVCDATAVAVGQGQAMRELDLIRVRGRKKPEKIFQVLSHHTDQTFPRMRELLAAYAQGRACLLGRDWSGAIAAFEQALRLNPTDHPSKLMLERTRALMKNPPGDDWDGVWSASDGG